MAFMLKETLNQILDRLGEQLDIPEHIYEDAIVQYETVGQWLDADDSPLKGYTPEIFPQGSFRLGTAVHPLNDDGEYDIDLVCHLTIPKENTTQAELKDKVGDRLKADKRLNNILDESRRCWRLSYPQQFHMDVLPAIPNEEQTPTGILLTDTELRLWQKSNPKAYADWFYDRMAIVISTQREAFYKSNSMMYKSIEDVPQWKVRTPLQRGVQILKRHRDIYFANDHENCPVSIILTTLAAKAYNNQNNIVDAIIGMVRNMPRFIELREGGKWWVENPTEPGENFADKWNEKPARREAFLKWLRQVETDFTTVLASHSFKESNDRLSKALGMADVAVVTKALGLPSNTPTSIRSSTTIPYVPPLGNTRHVQALQYPEQIRGQAQLRGAVHKGRSSWPLSERSVPKNVKLKFQLTTNIRIPFTVCWQVVNTGVEAERANQLRGGFYSSDESSQLVLWEHTGYTGTHWVEAFIIKDGLCIARTGKRIVKVR